LVSGARPADGSPQSLSGGTATLTTGSCANHQHAHSAPDHRRRRRGLLGGSVSSTLGLVEVGNLGAGALACGGQLTGAVQLAGNAGSLELNPATVIGPVTVTGTTGIEPFGTVIVR
jgi:hypothetical protein